MIQSENVNEFIDNMKLKRSVVGGIKEESVYENMRLLSDLYEAQVGEMKEQIRVLQEKNETMEQVYMQEQNRLKSYFADKLSVHQRKLNQFMDACQEFSDDVKVALEEYQSE
ncbi:MAG: hypothetical protein ACERKN_00390 [Velocimicrobium sp.]